PITSAKVGILGLTFKENVPDIRNSRVPSIIDELSDYGISSLVHDSMASAEEARDELGIILSPLDQFFDMDVVILAVGHDDYISDVSLIPKMISEKGILIDLKSRIDPAILSKESV